MERSRLWIPAGRRKDRPAEKALAAGTEPFRNSLPLPLRISSVRRKISEAGTCDDRGSALVLALLILAVVTLLGVTATTTTEIETLIAGNEKYHKIAFYHADSGVYATPKLIRMCVEEPSGLQPPLAAPMPPRMGYLADEANHFLRQVMGYEAYDGGASDLGIWYEKAVRPDVQVDVRRVRQINTAGGGAEFASGAEGVGAGSPGGVAVVYEMHSAGRAPGNSEAKIDARYRHVLGVAGGL